MNKVVNKTMNKVKALIAIGFLLGLTACASYSPAAIYDNEAKIATNSNSYSMVNSEQKILNQDYEGFIGKFEGTDTLWTYEAPQDEAVDLSHFVTIYRGKMKLVLITPDDSVTTIAEFVPENNQDSAQTTVVQLKSGKNKIKVVGGEDAQFDMQLSIPVGKLETLGD